MKQIVKVVDLFSVLLMLLLTLTVSAQVISRFFYPLTWSEEFAKINLMWLIYITLMASFYYDKHVRIDLIDSWRLLSKKTKKAINFIFTKVFGVVFSVFVTIYAFQLFQVQYDKGQATSILQWPLYVIVIPFIIGGILTFIYFVYACTSTISQYIHARKSRSEG